jgi:hypothetical protein
MDELARILRHYLWDLITYEEALDALWALDPIDRMYKSPYYWLAGIGGNN